MSGDTTALFFQELKEKTVKPGDKFYIVNDKTKCAIYMSEQTQSYGAYGQKRVAKGTSLNVAHVFTFDKPETKYNRNTKKNVQAIRFRYIGDNKDPHKNEYYMGFSKQTKYDHVYFLGSNHPDIEFVRLFKRNDTVGTVEPKYFTPYIIESVHDSPAVIGYKESTTELWTTDVDPTTKYWFFVPAKTPSGISPLCYYQEHFAQTLRYDPKTGRYSESGNYPSCANPREIVDICKDQLNKYCSSGDNAFGKNVCYRWFKDNYYGVADNAIIDVCSRKENEDKRQCGCIAPIQNITQENIDKNQLELDYTCYGVGCKNNNFAWYTREQSEQKASCPDTLCTIQNVKTGSGKGLEIGQNCSKKVIENIFTDNKSSQPIQPTTPSDDIKPPRKPEKQSNLWLYIVVGAVIVIAIIGLFYFITRKGNNQQQQSSSLQYYDPRNPYNTLR